MFKITCTQDTHIHLFCRFNIFFFLVCTNNERNTRTPAILFQFLQFYSLRWSIYYGQVKTEDANKKQRKRTTTLNLKHKPEHIKHWIYANQLWARNRRSNSTQHNAHRNLSHISTKRETAKKSGKSGIEMTMKKNEKKILHHNSIDFFNIPLRFPFVQSGIGANDEYFTWMFLCCSSNSSFIVSQFRPRWRW